MDKEDEANERAKRSLRADPVQLVLSGVLGCVRNDCACQLPVGVSVLGCRRCGT
jgi:uncharacterized OsmC-like protein